MGIRDPKQWWAPMLTMPFLHLQSTGKQSSSQSSMVTGEPTVPSPPGLKPLFKEVHIKLKPLDEEGGNLGRPFTGKYCW